MKASVVLPVFNKAPFLKECLDSVLAQSFSAFELIAVDDASTDGSLELLRSIDDPRLRIIALDKNVGPGGAAQRGIDVGSGEYIIRVDADDVMLPGRFANQVAMLDRDPSIGACSGHLRLLADPTVLRRLDLADDDCKARMLFSVPLHQASAAYRRSVLVKNDIRYLDHWPHYGEDWMHQVALSRVTRFKNVDEAMVLYRTGPSSTSQGRDRAADLRVLYRYVFKELGIPLTEEELDLQLYALKCFARPVDRESVVDFKRWLDRIALLDQHLHVFSKPALQRQLVRVWDEFFYHLPSIGLSAAWAHLRAGRSFHPSKLYYLLAMMVNGTSNVKSKAQ